MAKLGRFCLMITLLLFSVQFTYCQVNSVTYGKNRVQYKKFKWQYIQTDNFNVFFHQNGEELAKFVAQEAEQELPKMETASEYSLQRRANIVLYNDYAEMLQTNIGLQTDFITEGGNIQLVNNKIILYFDANHASLTRQIRKGIAEVITKNVLFGSDLGEVAGNQTLLDLPQWLTDGYIGYLAENWSTELDDELKSEMLSGNYNKFSSFAFARPKIAGHAFWYYIEEKYKKENVTYFFYLTRMYKSLNKASLQIAKMKFNDLLADFMEYEEDKYYQDITKRKAYPKGSYVDGFDISPRLNYYRFNVNPNKRDNSYVVTQFKKGIVRVILNVDFENKTLLKYGVRSYESQMNPNYPMMAWDPKGSHIAVIYSEEGKLKLFVYDIIDRIKRFKIDLTKEFDQVQDVKYYQTNQKLLLSAVKNGHTDIYIYDLNKEKAMQVTNDVYDDLDPSFVAFPNKTGIVFASNRPNASAKGGDTSLPGNNRYNIFMVTDFGDKADLNQITQLSDLKYGNARYPMQYNGNHFTFVSDENGVGNRWAGFFTTQREGLDTLVLISDEILRNPSQDQIDSTLKVYDKSKVDSIAVVSITKDSAYTFPITNYQSSLAETRVAGENNQVSEVTRQSDEKTLYKLKIDEYALKNRNVTAQPTNYMKKLMRESTRTEIKPAAEVNQQVTDTSNRQLDFFQNEFEPEKRVDSATGKEVIIPLQSLSAKKESVLETAKIYRYKPVKFSADFGSIGFNSMVLINRYQPYTGGSGPIKLNSSTPLNGMITLGTSELLEDYRVMGALKLGTNLKDNEWYLSFSNLKRRLDWGLSYYRNTQAINAMIVDANTGNAIASYPGKMFTNLYQASLAYPFDPVKSIRLTTGIRSDKFVIKSVDDLSHALPDQQTQYSVNHLEFVYDNTLNPTMNIWNGLRYKVYLDWNAQVSKIKNADGRNTFNFGFDARYYYPIYRNFIWAGRAAGDFSWGNQKIIYYLGGMDGWMMFGNNLKEDKNGGQRERFFYNGNTPDPDNTYAFQSLAVNMRGYLQNIANGNNAVVINSEFRLPVVSTFFDKTVNNSFLRNFMITQFIDIGTAWNGAYDDFKRPEIVYQDYDNSGQPLPVSVRKKAGGFGPFAAGYGFGARSTLLGYFLKYDVGWPMNGFFKGRPVMYLSLGLDF